VSSALSNTKSVKYNTVCQQHRGYQWQSATVPVKQDTFELSVPEGYSVNMFLRNREENSRRYCPSTATQEPSKE
jgi:hypothetical protein